MSSRVAIEIHLRLLEYSMLFIHKQSRFVRDSGSMSATVGACLQQWELHQLQSVVEVLNMKISVPNFV